MDQSFGLVRLKLHEAVQRVFPAPVTAGGVGDALQDVPDLTPEQLEERIVNTPSRVAHPDPSLAEGRVAAIVVVPPQQASRDGRLAP